MSAMLQLTDIEQAAPASVGRFELFTGVGSVRNLAMYRKAGYRRVAGENPPGTVLLSKKRP